MGKPKRERTLRRESARKAERLARNRERLFLLELGGSPERPIDVDSAAVVEIRARGVPCPRCERARGGRARSRQRTWGAPAGSTPPMPKMRLPALHVVPPPRSQLTVYRAVDERSPLSHVGRACCRAPQQTGVPRRAHAGSVRRGRHEESPAQRGGRRAQSRRAHGGRARRRRAHSSRPRRPARGNSVRREGSRGRGRASDDAWLEAVQGSRARSRLDAGGAAQSGRRDSLRQDQRAGVRDERDHEKPRLWRDSFALEPRADTRRLERRFCRGARRRDAPARHGQ